MANNISSSLIRYRTESFSGSRERDAAEVMAYETFDMGNTDILEYLSETILKDNPICEKFHDFIRELDENGYVEDMGWFDKVDFFKAVLDEIKKATTLDIKYALWLADENTVFDFYGCDMAGSVLGVDYDAYVVGPVILSDLGYDGALYGYVDFPEPLSDRKNSLNNLIMAAQKNESGFVYKSKADKER